MILCRTCGLPNDSKVIVSFLIVSFFFHEMNACLIGQDFLNFPVGYILIRNYLVLLYKKKILETPITAVFFKTHTHNNNKNNNNKKPPRHQD